MTESGAFGYFQCFTLIAMFSLIGPKVSAFFESKTEEKKLSSYLEERLTQNSPPAGMYKQTVFLFLGLYQIVDVDEKNGHLTLKLWMYTYYKVGPLWEPTEYSNTTRMQFPRNTFWEPDIVPLDAIDVEYQSYPYQAVLYHGLVVPWSSMITVKFSCSFDISHFPFDEHDCPLVFGQWTWEANEYIINHDVDFGVDENVDVTFYKTHNQWNLVQPTLIVNQYRHWHQFFNYSDKILGLKIRRDPKFYLYIFVCPIIILQLLSPFVFLVPVESGEKLSMSITLLLAQTVSMGGIADVLPASSRKFPIISYFLGLSILQMGIQVLLTVLVINMYGISGCRPLPYPLKAILACRIVYIFGLTPFPAMKIHPETEMTSEFPEEKEPNKTSGKKRGNKIPETNAGFEESSVMGSHASEECLNEGLMWKRFAILLDRFLFGVNVLVITFLFATMDHLIVP